MPKTSGLPEDTSPTTDDYVPSLDNGTTTLKKSKWLNVISMIAQNIMLVIYNPYKFSAYLTVAQSSINGSILMNLDTKLFDTSSNFSTTTHLFTAPIAGFYYFSFSICVGGAGTSPGQWQSLIQKNGTTSVLFGNNNATTSFGQSVGSGLIQLAANDTIGLFIVANGSQPIQTLNTVTYLHGFLLSKT